MKQLIITGAIFGFLAVALGAFGAHALKQHISEDYLKIYQKGIEYQFYHVFAIFLSAVLLKLYPGFSPFKMAGWLFAAGIVLFSGSLYAYSLSQSLVVALLTPIGGISFLLGWGILLAGAFKIPAN